MLTTSKGYVEPEAFEPCALLVDYPGSFGVAVTFAEIGDGVVCATAQPVPSGMMANAAVQEAIDMLRDAGCALDIRRIIAD